MSELVCWKCGASLKAVPKPITRHSNCLSCYAELHCCRMCRRYDRRYAGGCTDDRTHPPEDKERANYCEYYLPRSDAFSPEAQAEADRAREELEALFGAGSSRSPENDTQDMAGTPGPKTEEQKAREELERLFGNLPDGSKGSRE